MASSKKKKKKAASNPARGFATVSQPSKSKEIHELVDQDQITSQIADGISNDDERPIQDRNSAPATSEVTNMSPDELEAYLEDSELQRFIDAHLSRSNQEASRQVARVEQERRQLRAQAHRLSVSKWLSQDVVDDVLHKYTAPIPVVNSDPNHPLNGDDHDILFKLRTLQKTLTSLNLPRVDEAIEHVLKLLTWHKITALGEYIWGFTEALDWYAVSCSQEDLPDYEHGKIASAVSPSVQADNPQEIEIPKAELDPQRGQKADTDAGQILIDEENVEVDLPLLSSSESDDDEPALLTEKYLRLQTLLFHTEKRIGNIGKPSAKLGQRKSRLLKRIRSIDQDVLFDADAAEAIWNQSLRDLEAEAAKTSRHQKLRSKKTKDKQEIEDLSDDDGDVLADIFASGDELGDSRNEEENESNVRVVDFGKWTGIQPRRLLEENCRNLDSLCKLKFTTISATSYSNRQRLDIIWSADRALEDYALKALPAELECKSSFRKTFIEMTKIATASLVQAESYLSTMLLFLLIQSKHCDPKQSARLPSVWRHNCDDLISARKLLVASDEKDNLRLLQALIHNVKRQMEDHGERTIRDAQRTSSELGPKAGKYKDIGFSVQESTQARWELRVNSPAFQNMLLIRQRLPIHAFKKEILTSINQNQSIIICADTGAGKSTQVPSFLLEDQFTKGRDCRILVTQPRRISAISLARRVSEELGEAKMDLGTDRSLIGYAIRLESKTSQSTRITYATTGVLLRMLESSPSLEHLDYLILDEVHERSMDLDLLFIALKRLQQRRNSLRVILMSATVDAQKFSAYFGNIPILNVPGRTFPVEVKHLEDAIEDTIDLQTSSQILDDHSNDDNTDDGSDGTRSDTLNSVNMETYSSKTRLALAQMDEYRIDYHLIASLVEVIVTREKYKRYSSAILIFMPGLAEIRRLYGELMTRSIVAKTFLIHLLHSTFSTEDLEEAFAIPPRGKRKIVIATNIAETGITIPDVTAVIDTCKEKVMRFNERRQLSKLTEGFISRSSARQRRGRAARVQDGLCFHLVTRHRFEQLMLEQHVPEMLRLSLQDPILRIKVWNLGSIEETLASAIDPPSMKNVRRAIEKLKDAGALNSSEDLTALGKHIVQLPLEVVLGKFAIFGVIFQCLDAVLVIVAALSSKSPFASGKNGSQADARLAFARGESDLISTLNAYQGWRKARTTGSAHQYCRKNHLSDQILSTIEDQRVQLLVYLADAGLLDLSQGERSLLNQSRTIRNRKDFFDIPSRYNTHMSDELLTCIIAMVLYPKILIREGKGWRNVFTNQHMSLSPQSVNRAVDKPPKWLCFYEAMQTRSGTLSVLETSRVPEIAVALALGAADFRHYSGVISIDNGRIKICVREWKQLAAIKALREALGKLLARCWQTPNLRLSESDRRLIDTFASIVAARDTKLA